MSEKQKTLIEKLFQLEQFIFPEPWRRMAVNAAVLSPKTLYYNFSLLAPWKRPHLVPFYL